MSFVLTHQLHTQAPDHSQAVRAEDHQSGTGDAAVQAAVRQCDGRRRAVGRSAHTADHDERAAGHGVGEALMRSMFYDGVDVRVYVDCNVKIKLSS